jgi:hypothetical protein
LEDELERIRLILEELLGRPSRWSGVLELTDDPAVNGAKPFRCDIVINAALIGQDARWRTLIHEMLRPTILVRLGVSADEAALAQAESNHNYNVYIRALETLRQSLNIPPERFFLELLSEPIKTRAALVIGMAHNLPPSQSHGFLRTFSAAFTILKDRSR